MSDSNPDLKRTRSDGTRPSVTEGERSSSPTPTPTPTPVQGRYPVSAASAPARAEVPAQSDSARIGWVFVGAGVLIALVLSGVVLSGTRGAARRLAERASEARPEVAIASQAEVDYCTPQFKEVLKRVLHACGLEGATSRHGCAPSDVKSFASISDDDFNALFTPLRERGAVLLFDNAEDTLDEASQRLLDEKYADRRGARYFFAVARASKSGNQSKNRALSHRRANSVKFHVAQTAADPDLDKKFGQLWLGNEFAQLNKTFCDWPNSRPDQKCSLEAINRSVFVSWVDCRL